MRCKKHVSDQSSGVGVCASCLRERLFVLIAAQAQAQQAHVQAQLLPDHGKPSPNPQPPLAFPRSVSPYVSRRKSDASAAATWGHPPPHDQNSHHHHQHRNHHRLRFYSTPQVGPTYSDSSSSAVDPGPYGNGNNKKKKKSRFSLFSSLFRSRSEKFQPDARPGDPYASSSSSTPSWFSAIFPGGGGNRARSSEDCSRGCDRSRKPATGRGMSPDFGYACADDFDGDRSPSGSGDSAETSPSWKRTPAVAPPSARRSKPCQSRNVAGLTFCLSPLVRASPNRHWTNQKGIPPEIGKPGEAARVPAKPHLSNAASFCKNRSRKLADFGRANLNR